MRLDNLLGPGCCSHFTRDRQAGDRGSFCAILLGNPKCAVILRSVLRTRFLAILLCTNCLLVYSVSGGHQGLVQLRMD